MVNVLVLYVSGKYELVSCKSLNDYQFYVNGPLELLHTTVELSDNLTSYDLNCYVNEEARLLNLQINPWDSYFDRLGFYTPIYGNALLVGSKEGEEQDIYDFIINSLI